MPFLHARHAMQAPAVAALLLAGLAVPAVADAAESYDGCNYTISSLPTTLNQQGVYCLRGDLAAALASGAAITVATNNVTVDCNDFKLGNLAAPPTTTATGIYAPDRQNTTVRRCNLRGYHTAIALTGAGHHVHDNRIDGSHRHGIFVFASTSVVRDNRVFDTGPGAGESVSGIRVNLGVDVIGNTVTGVELDTTTEGRGARGIDAQSNGPARLQDNTVREVTVTNGPGAMMYGIVTGGGHADVTGNFVADTLVAFGCADGTGLIHGNRASNVLGLAMNCDDGGNNLYRVIGD